MAADVRVRFTAEDVAEVLAAMQAVQNKARQTGRAAAGGVVDFTGALGGLRSILGQVGAIVSAGMFVNYVRQAGEGAEASQKLSRELSTTAAKIAALRVEAKLADTDLETLAPLIVRISALVDQAARTGEKAGAFKALGLDPQVLKSLDALDRFYAVSKAIKNTADGPEKLTASYALFGKQTHQDILILQEFSATLDEISLRIPGVLELYSPTAIANAARMNEQFKETSIVVGGLATQFAGGFGSGIGGSLQGMNRELTVGAVGWQRFGEVVGAILGFLVTLVTTSVDVITTKVVLLADTVGSLVRATAAAATGNLSEAQVHLEAIGLRAEREYKLLDERVKRTWDLFLHPPQIPPPKGPELPKTPVDLDAIYQKQAALERAKIDQSIAAIRAAGKLREDMETAGYERGLTAVRDYYANRRAIIQNAIDEEIVQLQKRIQYERAKNPDQADASKTVQELNARIALLRLQYFGEIQKLRVEEGKAIDDLGAKQIESLNQVRDLQGRNHEARLAEIAQEIEAEYHRPGAAEPGAVALIEQKRRALILEADYQEQLRASSSALSGMGAEEARIRDRADAGLRSQVLSEKEILDLRKDQLPALRAEADLLLAAAEATQNPERIAQAREFSDQVHQLELNVQKAQDVLGQIGATAIDSATAALEDFFSKGVFEAKNFSDAMRQMALSIVSSLNQIISKMLATAIIQKTLGFLNPGSVKLGSPGSAAEAPGATFAAEGGYLRGAGTGTSDSNVALNRSGRRPLFWSDGEYMMPAQKVSERGARVFLDRFRARGMHAIGDYISDNPAIMNAPFAGVAPGPMRPIPVASRMPDYGPAMPIPNFLGDMHREYLRSIAGAEPRDVNADVRGALEVHLGDGLVAREVERVMNSGRGRDIQLKVVSKNRKKFNRALGND